MLDLSQDWAKLPGRSPLREQRQVGTMASLPDPKVQARWPIPDKLVVRAAVSGRSVRNAGPDAPKNRFALNLESFAQQAAEAIDAGAASVHLDLSSIVPSEGVRAAMQPQYEKVVSAIRAATRRDWVVDVNILHGETFLDNILPITSGLGETTVMAADNPVEWMEAVARVVTDRGKKLFFAPHGTAEVDLADRLVIRKGILEKPYCWCILIGYAFNETSQRLVTSMPNPKAMIQELTQIVDRIREIDDDCYIEVCAAGRAAQYLATLAVLMGLHVRMGTEDTVWRWPHKDEFLTGASENVTRMRVIAEQLGRPLATAEDLRKMLRIKSPATKR